MFGSVLFSGIPFHKLKYLTLNLSLFLSPCFQSRFELVSNFFENNLGWHIFGSNAVFGRDMAVIC